jgi:hypothetical protein
MNFIHNKTFLLIGAVLVCIVCTGVFAGQLIRTDDGAHLFAPSNTQYDSTPPVSPVRLIFIHHSTGENWLSNDNGKLGISLRDNNYFVSDTNYGWGPEDLDAGSERIGDHTDIGNWYSWFRGPHSSAYLSALYAESGQNCSYSRMDENQNPGGENEIIMFKSCFPNSNLQGVPHDTVPAIENNPLRGQDSSSEFHTVANAKGIYIDLLEYFRTRQDKLFIVITAPPLTDPANAANARVFNQFLVTEWLTNYPYNNVFVFDFYNVLTTNGGTPNINDLNRETGNHHRWWNNAIQHKIDGDNDGNPNVSEYPSRFDDDHPNLAGNEKATGEFLQLLNIAYNRWRGNNATTTTVTGSSSTTTGLPVTTTTTIQQSPCPLASSLDNQGQIATLRAFRDSWITTGTGAQLTALYYQNAAEVKLLLRRHPALKAQVQQVVAENIAVIRKLAACNEVTVSVKELNAITGFLNYLKSAGSPQLKIAIDWVIKSINNGSLLSELGVKVVQGP